MPLKNNKSVSSTALSSLKLISNMEKKLWMTIKASLLIVQSMPRAHKGPKLMPTCTSELCHLNSKDEIFWTWKSQLCCFWRKLWCCNMRADLVRFTQSLEQFSLTLNFMNSLIKIGGLDHIEENRYRFDESSPILKCLKVKYDRLKKNEKEATGFANSP